MKNPTDMKRNWLFYGSVWKSDFARQPLLIVMKRNLKNLYNVLGADTMSEMDKRGLRRRCSCFIRK